jgi:hypothetical protein
MPRISHEEPSGCIATTLRSRPPTSRAEYGRSSIPYPSWSTALAVSTSRIVQRALRNPAAAMTLSASADSSSPRPSRAVHSSGMRMFPTRISVAMERFTARLGQRAIFPSRDTCPCCVFSLRPARELEKGGRMASFWPVQLRCADVGPRSGTGRNADREQIPCQERLRILIPG